MSMDDFEGSYAPQSPDLSEYQSFDQPQADPFSTTQSSYQTSSQQPVPQPQNSHPDFYPQDQFPSQPPPNPLTYDPFGPDPSSFPGRQQYPPPSQVQYQPNLPTMPKHSRSQFDQSQQDWLPPNQQPAAKPGRKSKKAKVEEEVCEKPAPGVEEGIEVKTKFPVARIKRIMQADEDVGKVSQVTPTAVSKALELFIISLTLKSSSIAREKSSRRVTAAHLKQAVQGDEQLDFLEQIVSKVPDAPTASKPEKGGGKKSAVDEESSDEAYVEQAGKKEVNYDGSRLFENSSFRNFAAGARFPFFLSLFEFFPVVKVYEKQGSKYDEVALTIEK